MAREAAEKRAELERKRQEAEENARKQRREDYQKKLAAVMDATSQKDRVRDTCGGSVLPQSLLLQMLQENQKVFLLLRIDYIQY